MRSSQFLFIHGGPGFNSFAEKKLLTPFFKRAGANISFWNEPSRLRSQGEPFYPDRAFERWCESVAKCFESYRKQKQTIRILSHSFAIHALARLVDSYDDVIEDITVFSSSLGYPDAILNILAVAKGDLERLAPEKACELGVLLAKKPKFFDDTMKKALELSTHDTELFLNYWQNKAVMKEFFEIGMSDPQAQFDGESFFHVCGDLARVGWKVSPIRSGIQISAVYGKLDPIINISKELPLVRSVFPNLNVHLFDQSRHYPYLEETPILMKLLGLN